MSLSQEQLTRAQSCAASARRAAGATDEEMNAALNFVVAASDNTGVRTEHRPAGSLPGVAGTFAELANGNKVVRFNGYANGVMRMYGFTIPAGE